MKSRTITATGLLLATALAVGLSVGQFSALPADDWCSVSQAHADPTHWGTWLIETDELPDECINGTCAIGETCPLEVPYVHRAGVLTVTAPRPVGAALKSWADEGAGDWIGTWGDAGARADKTALARAHDCWQLPQSDQHPVTGEDVPRLCIHGRVYGVGLGGETTCTEGARRAGKPMPCVSERGAQWATQALEETYDGGAGQGQGRALDAR